jgi:hypothetical protein
VTYADISLDSFIDQVGSYAGFAATIGLALLALLLFAQARELKRLREWGGSTHDRIADLERRLAGALELARRAGAAGAAATRSAATGATSRPAAARPAGAPAPARSSAPTKLPLLPAAPAGVGAPALASATVGVRLPGAPVAPVVAEPVARPPVPTEQPAAVTSPPPATAAAQGAAPATTVAPPSTPPQSGNGHAPGPPPPPRPSGPPRSATPPRPPARPSGPRPPAPRPTGRPAARPVPAAPLRARGASATPRGGGPEAPPSRRGLLPLLAGFGAIVAVIVALIVITSGGDPSPSGSAGARTTASQPQSSPRAAPPHSQTVVAVLNGTSVEGLANQVSNELAADGFVRGRVTNASSADRSVTVVSYFGSHQAEAEEVAETLGVSADAVEPIDADTEASACPPADQAPCTASVVVTVGADRQPEMVDYTISRRDGHAGRRWASRGVSPMPPASPSTPRDAQHPPIAPLASTNLVESTI